jgi:hypothetical protein
MERRSLRQLESSDNRQHEANHKSDHGALKIVAQDMMLHFGHFLEIHVSPT